VGYSSHLGSTKPNASTLDEKAAPLKALLARSAGSVDAVDGKLPHSSGPMIAIAAKAGLGVAAGQEVQFSSGETVAIMSGADTQIFTGGQLRLHCGQAIGVLAGAEKAGEGNVGLQLIAGKGAMDYQAQADELKVQARDEINVISSNAHIDWAAAKSISLSTAGGANITIADGKLMIHAGAKKFNDPAKLNYSMPGLPKSVCVECLKKSLAAGPAFTMVE
jgi:type VI secretion system secreted protein VgrG